MIKWIDANEDTPLLDSKYKYLSVDVIGMTATGKEVACYFNYRIADGDLQMGAN